MFETQIKAGANLLDEKLPGWEKKIDLEKLDLSDCTICVIGQAYPDTWYEDALKDLLNVSSTNEALDESFEYGFAASENYPALTQEWKQFITDRRKQKNVPS